MAGAGTASGAVKAAGILEVAAVIVTGPVIEQIRRELRRRTGQDMDPAELGELITSSVLRPDALGRARAATVVCGIPVGRMRTWPAEITRPGHDIHRRRSSNRHIPDIYRIPAVKSP